MTKDLTTAELVKQKRALQDNLRKFLDKMTAERIFPLASLLIPSQTAFSPGSAFGVHPWGLEQTWISMFGKYTDKINEVQFIHAIDSIQGWPEHWSYRNKLGLFRLLWGTSTRPHSAKDEGPLTLEREDWKSCGLLLLPFNSPVYVAPQASISPSDGMDLICSDLARSVAYRRQELREMDYTRSSMVTAEELQVLTTRVYRLHLLKLAVYRVLQGYCQETSTPLSSTALTTKDKSVLKSKFGPPGEGPWYSDVLVAAFLLWDRKMVETGMLVEPDFHFYASREVPWFLKMAREGRKGGGGEKRGTSPDSDLRTLPPPQPYSAHSGRRRGSRGEDSGRGGIRDFQQSLDREGGSSIQLRLDAEQKAKQQREKSMGKYFDPDKYAKRFDYPFQGLEKNPLNLPKEFYKKPSSSSAEYGENKKGNFIYDVPREQEGRELVEVDPEEEVRRLSGVEERWEEEGEQVKFHMDSY